MIPFMSELPEWEPVDSAVRDMVRGPQRILDGLTCPVHGAEPILVLRKPEGSVVERLEINSCCEALAVLVRRRFAKSRGLPRVSGGADPC